MTNNPKLELNSLRFRQNKFKSEAAQHSDLCEHRRDSRNSFVSTLENDAIQKALLQAAKAGNIKLMRELIDAGANPFTLDDAGCNAFSYAQEVALEETIDLLRELDSFPDHKKLTR